MIGKNSARIQIVITKEEAKKLEDIAKKESRSVSNLTARLLRQALKKIQK